MHERVDCIERDELRFTGRVGCVTIIVVCGGIEGCS